MSDTPSTATIPAPLLRIAVLAVPVVVVCALAAGARDQKYDPASMTDAAIAARLKPVASAPPAAVKPVQPAK